MNYQVLARKWRPHSFREIVGQQHVVRSLTHALDQGRLHHALLFTGTRGVGKTTLARIFAKALNCEQGVSSTPCGECSACREVDQGRFVDLIEIDAASRTKVEDTRELLDNVQYAPSRGRYKVYLIDEVHMLSNHSFNALLKTLEEPPPHVKFILATTDPQRLPVTVLSRCLQFNLKRLPDHLIADHLSKILEQENIDYEAAALRQIAQAGEGSMRDALTLLDQAIAYASGDLSAASVAAMLGTIEHRHVIHLLDALAAADAQALARAITDLHQDVPDYDEVLAELLSALQRIALLQALPNGGVEKDWPDREDLSRLATSLKPADVQLYYQFGLLGRRDLPWAAQPRSGFEMIMLRMLCFTQEGLVADATNQQSAPAAPGRQAPAPALSASESKRAQAVLDSVRQQREQKAHSDSSNEIRQTAVQQTAKNEPEPSPLAQPIPDEEPGVAQPIAAQPIAAQPIAAQPNAVQPGVAQPELQDWAERWHQIVAQLPLQGIALQLAKQTAVKDISGRRVTLVLDASHKGLCTEQTEARLREALSQLAGGPLKLNIVIDAVDAVTPAQIDNQRKAEQQQAAERLIQDDPNVQALKTTFNASIRTGSVRPIEN